jgi:serine/threonine protein kinase
MEVLGNYTVAHTIGQGEFATVRLGEHVDEGYKVAMKFVERCKLDESVHNEISNQRRLCHKNVIKIEDVLETDDAMCIVQEHAAGGDLFDYVVRHSRLKEDEARRLFCQLVDGIGHCHEQMVVHRDIKPENILMDADGNLKIADFGFSSRWCKGEFLTQSCGSPDYAAPELLYRGCKYEGPETDVWSCGVVLYVLLCGCLPFQDDDFQGLVNKIRRGKFTIPGYVPSEAKDLILKILTKNPSQRLSLNEIRQHPWLQGHFNTTTNETSLLETPEPERPEEDRALVPALEADVVEAPAVNAAAKAVAMSLFQRQTTPDVDEISVATCLINQATLWVGCYAQLQYLQLMSVQDPSMVSSSLP